MKKCIILVPKMAVAYKNMFPLIKGEELHAGYTRPKGFIMPDGKETDNMGGLTLWLTNVGPPIPDSLELTASYYQDSGRYPKYDNYDAIEVSRLKDIPFDYPGTMGVPVTFLLGYHPEFEILGLLQGEYGILDEDVLGHQGKIDGKSVYTRVIIKRKDMNEHLHAARKAKNDELYTRESDFAAEIAHYDLKGQWVYSCCSDYRFAAIPRYFTEHFHELGLKHYTATCFDNGNGAMRYDYDGHKATITKLKGNGSFDSPECTAIMKEADIVIENPPFSRLRDFIEWLKAA